MSLASKVSQFILEGKEEIQHLELPGTGGGGLFKEVNALSHARTSDGVETENAKYNNTICGTIAKDKRFEFTTMFFICINAVSIGYDIDYSARYPKPDNLYDPDTPIGFKIIENVFATYFTVEVIIRFFAYKKFSYCICDPWFIFDGLLVLMMVAETWILPFFGDGGPFAQLSVLRLVRLLRITRMARLMRSLPELMLIVKGMAAAVRAVVWTVILLILISFTWAILFTSEYHQGKLPDDDDDVQSDLDGMFSFGSMGKSFFSLIIMGTILDDVTYASDVIRSTHRPAMTVAFVLFIIISSFMMLNMLLGILVEVVDKSSTGEKERVKRENFQEAVNSILNEMDKDHNDKVSAEEFYELQHNKLIQEALEDMQIDESHFRRFGELMFAGEDSGQGLNYTEISNIIVRLSPGAFVSSLDFNALSQVVKRHRNRLRRRLEFTEHKMQELVRQRCGVTLQTIPETPRSMAPSRQQSKENNRPQKMGSPVAPDSLMTFPGVVPDPSGWHPEGVAATGPAKSSQSSSSSTGGPKAGAGQPQSPNDSRRIGIHTLALLESTSSCHIIEELQRRLKITDLGDTGVPFTMLDEELQARVQAAEGGVYAPADPDRVSEVKEAHAPAPPRLGVAPA